MIASVAGRASAVPTAARGPSIYAVTTVMPRVLEIGIFNTTTTAMAVGLARATTTGTQGAGLTEISESDTSQTPLATTFNTHTADATVGGVFRQGTLGAAAGAGIVFTFVGDGIYIPNTTASGLVIVCPTGTGQIIDFYICWRE